MKKTAMLQAAAGAAGGAGYVGAFSAVPLLAPETHAAEHPWVLTGVDIAANSLVVVCFRHATDTDSTGITSAHLTFAKADRAFNSDVSESGSVWYAYTSTARAGEVISVAFAANQTGVAIVDQVRVQGLNTVSPVRQFKSVAGSGTNCTVSLDSSPTGPTYGFGQTQNDSGDWTAGSGYTLIRSAPTGAPKGVQSEAKATGSQTVNFTSPNVFWSIVGLELAA